jgi:hypothetical protein
MTVMQRCIHVMCSRPTRGTSTLGPSYSVTTSGAATLLGYLGVCVQAVTRHYEAALLDAQGALDLDATNLKAHLRKAQVCGCCV